MKDKLNRFIENIGGNFVEISYRDAIYQCMDLVYAWVFVLDIPKATIQNQYAYQVWTKPKAITKEYFDLLENTPDFVPVAGDLAVFKGGEAGHIGIVADNNNDVNGFNIFEQNLPLRANPRVRRSNYNNIIGFLRPKVQAIPQPEPIIEEDTIIPQIIDGQGNAMPVFKIVSTIKDQARDLEACQKNTKGRIKEEVEKEKARQQKYCDERVDVLKKSLEADYKTKLVNLENGHGTELSDLKIKYEKLLLRKVKDFGAGILFGLWLKKLLGRTGK
jgi:hypothetical protein